MFADYLFGVQYPIDTRPHPAGSEAPIARPRPARRPPREGEWGAAGRLAPATSRCPGLPHSHQSAWRGVISKAFPAPCSVSEFERSTAMARVLILQNSKLNQYHNTLQCSWWQSLAALSSKRVCRQCSLFKFVSAQSLSTGKRSSQACGSCAMVLIWPIIITALMI